jgi:ABC-type sugar transport system substrate-binding protein
VRREGLALIQRASPPEYLLMTNNRSLAAELLPQADAAGIKVFLINEGLLTAERDRIGKPREKLTHWLGELVPDDCQCGQLLADSLIAAARERGKVAGDGKIHVGGIGGAFTMSSLARVTGLRTAVHAHEDVSLVGVFPANWERAKAREVTARQFADDPAISIVWAGSDEMALGAIDAIAAAGRAPGEDVLIGGVDWASFVPAKIREGVLTASAGGHCMDGAWALVLLYDAHHGRVPESFQEKSHFEVITRDNLDDYAPLFDESWRRVDFSRFSKARNPQLAAYDFTLAALLRPS